MARSDALAKAVLCLMCVVGLGLVGACDDDGGESDVDAAKVAQVLARVADEPAEARQLLTGRAEGSLAEQAAAAGLPSADVVSWLLDDHGFPDRTTDLAAEVLQVATNPVAGKADEMVAAQVVGSPQVTVVMRPAVADLLADRVPEMLSSFRTNRPWSPDDLTWLLGELGGASMTRATITTAITDHARAGIRAGKFADDELVAKLVRPTGWLIGVTDAGALNELDDSEADRLVRDRSLDLETLAEQAMLAAGRSKVKAQALSVDIHSGYREGLDAADWPGPG